MFNSCDILTESSSKAGFPYPLKKYLTNGENIPLKKNWSETWCTLPTTIENRFEEILNLEIRSDDVFVVSFMKSGNTWMKHCAWLLMNDLDFETSKEPQMSIRSPIVELGAFVENIPNPIEICNKLSSPRLMKSHLPANLLPLEIWTKKPKIIYVARNLKDVIVASFHFVKDMNWWQGDNFHDFVNDFLDNNIFYTHFWSHIVDFWRMRNEPFIFFVTYEEMKRDLAGVLQGLCTFLERPQLRADELEKTLEHFSFGSRKANKKLNLTNLLKEITDGFQFMRRGFKHELTPELQEKIDKWSEEFLGQHGLTEEDIFGKL